MQESGDENVPRAHCISRCMEDCVVLLVFQEVHGSRNPSPLLSNLIHSLFDT